MTHPTKCWRQAKQQQASKVKAFNNGFIQDLPDVALNLDYQPESDVEHSSDTGSDSLASNGMSFSLMDNSDIASEDGVGNSVTGSKRQRTGSHKFTNKATNETDNYVERCAGQAAMAAHQIWMDIHHTLRAMNDSELTCL
ncbi:hypothetical protein L210DRAFT_3512232 [Boletus edulis BED1]|uniref:Uncharacterized protein n=1 Tax=Boletus edulis BED1 TaxID=1328754 RepID=A0AAD4BBI4_BOLED|nr:hypothetical protein L210DRAFT_3512232 [Boletus edulis BED1]